jgi:hypothetical protein
VRGGCIEHRNRLAHRYRLAGLVEADACALRAGEFLSELGVQRVLGPVLLNPAENQRVCHQPNGEAADRDQHPAGHRERR